VKQERKLVMQQEATSPPSVKSLEQQLIEHLRTIPLSQAKQPVHMPDLVLHLVGKHRQNPHPQLVAVELRKLGFERRRLYGAEFEGKRYWFPPAF
jgi:hypothetical protein